VAVLSGRALADLRARVGLAGLVYGGCHGLEIAGPGVRFRHPGIRAARVTAARRLLLRRAARVPGAALEWKGLALALHDRRVPPARRAGVRALVADVACRFPDLAVIPGNRVYEFVPRVGWDKGAAARWIVRRLGPALGARPAVLYAGDDTTDEAAFRALRGRGVTVRIGGGPSAAEYTVRGVAEVHALLRRLARAIG
jgi:trehalose-phosphatase